MKAKDIRGRVISTRFTEAQHKSVTSLAAAEDLTPAEWLRELALKVTTPDRRLQILTEEIIAVRLILQNLIAHLTDRTVITVEILQEACANADRLKKVRARALFGIAPEPQGVTTNVQ